MPGCRPIFRAEDGYVYDRDNQALALTKCREEINLAIAAAIRCSEAGRIDASRAHLAYAADIRRALQLAIEQRFYQRAWLHQHELALGTPTRPPDTKVWGFITRFASRWSKR